MIQNDKSHDQRILKMRENVHMKLKNVEIVLGQEAEFSAEEADYVGAFEENAISTDATASVVQVEK